MTRLHFNRKTKHGLHWLSAGEATASWLGTVSGTGPRISWARRRLPLVVAGADDVLKF
jgi:hypothetical protein